MASLWISSAGTPRGRCNRIPRIPWPAGSPAGSSAGLGLDLPGTGSLPTAGIALVLVALVAGLVLLRGRRSAAPAPSWACGQVVGPELNWTGAGFSKPLRLVLEVVLRPQREIAVRSQGGVLQEVTYHGRVPQVIDERVYRPLVRRSVELAGYVRRMQSGSLGTYVAYLIAVTVVLLGAVRTGVIG